MGRTAILATVGVLAATAAVAVGDIPTRYSGSFPSDGLRTNIKGTFTGKALNLTWTVRQKGTPVQRSFAGACKNTSSQTSCAGRIDATIAAQVSISWSGGTPTAISISK
jgi:hypothetical protein